MRRGSMMSYDFERERYEERRRRAREARRDYEDALDAALTAVWAQPPVRIKVWDALIQWNATFTTALQLWDQSHDWRRYRL